MTDEVWIYVSGTGEVEAFDSQDAATNAGRDDPDAWVELVQIQHAPRVHDMGSRRRSWVSPPGLIYSGDGPDAA